MQPDARKSDTELPNSLYSLDADAWSPLLRAGPNGLVSVLTLVVWWGHALQARTRWQEDSQPMWFKMVNDLSKCLECLNQISEGGKKRKAVASGKDTVNKRYVFSAIVILLSADIF